LGAAQAGVDACQLVLYTGLGVPVLNGDVMCGYGYFSALPMGWTFMSMGHLYRIVARVFLHDGGGSATRHDVGANLDLHTCTPTGSTVTWAVRA
jgi:hypothetical protein